MSLIQVFNKEPQSNISLLLKRTLEPLPFDEQLEQLLHLFQNVNDFQEQFAEIVVSAWYYLLDSSVWKCQGSDLDCFKSAVDFEHNVKPYFELQQALSVRSAGLHSTIYRHWKISPSHAFPNNIQPPVVSQHLTRHIAQLSRICSHADAIQLVESQVQTRLNKAGFHHHAP